MQFENMFYSVLLHMKSLTDNRNSETEFVCWCPELVCPLSWDRTSVRLPADSILYLRKLTLHRLKCKKIKQWALSGFVDSHIYQTGSRCRQQLCDPSRCWAVWWLRLANTNTSCHQQSLQSIRQTIRCRTHFTVRKKMLYSEFYAIICYKFLSTCIGRLHWI